MSIQDPPALWDTALNELELQMTRATFDTWLRGTHCTGTDDDGNLLVEVKNEYAVEWLTHRLNTVVERTLQRLTGNGTQAVYVAAEAVEQEQPDTTSPPPESNPDPSTGLSLIEARLRQLLERVGDREARLLIQQEIAELRGDPQPRSTDPNWRPPKEEAKKRGWFRVTQYASQFWGPYLGARLFRLWEIIVRLDKRRNKTAWTPPRRFSAPTLAKEVGCCRQTISGTWRRCDPDEEDAVLRTPGNTFNRDDTEPEQEYFKRHKGLLERLADTGIARFTVEGVRSRKVYEISVKTDLGWLTPAQLATLPAEVQEEHDRFVSEMGLDPNLWRIG